MAILTNADYQNIKKRVKLDPVSRAEFRAWGLDKQTWYDLFQSVEDWFVSGFSVAPSTSFKSEIETITGATTNARAKATAYVWMGWRYDKNP